AQTAGKPQTIGVFGDWGAYTYTDDQGGKVCFMSSKPEKQQISVANARRGDVFLFVTHWQSDKTKNVVSAAVGYPLRKGSASIAVDGKSFDVFDQGEMIWTKDQKVDDTLAQAIQRGSKAVVKGTSGRGTKTTDTYSLRGTG